MCGAVGVLFFLAFLAVPARCVLAAHRARQYQVIADIALSAHCRNRPWRVTTIFRFAQAESDHPARKGEDRSSPRPWPPCRKPADRSVVMAGLADAVAP